MKTAHVVCFLFLAAAAAAVTFTALVRDSRILFFSALVLMGSVWGFRRKR